MSLYKISGMVKAIKRTSSSFEIEFVPDCEYAISSKSTMFVVLIANDDKEGIVFKCTPQLCIADKRKVKWISEWKIGVHYLLVIKKVKEKNCDIVLKDVPVSKYFQLESVTERA